MPKIRFVADFNHSTARVTTAYKAGMKLLVTRACAEKAIAKGKAVMLREGEQAKRAPIVRRRK